MNDNQARPLAYRDDETVETQQPDSLRVLRTVEEVLELRKVWQGICNHPNADLDFFLNVIELRSEILRPHVIVLSRNGVPVSLLVGRLEETALEIRMGYQLLLRPRLRQITIIYGGTLGDAGEADAHTLMAELLRCLKQGEAQAVWFNHLPAESPFYQAITACSSVLFRDYFPAGNQHWRAPVLAGFQEFQRTRSDNTRHNLRRYSKRFQNAFGQDLTIKIFRNLSEFEQIVADTDAISRKSYHRGLGVGFIDNAETRQLLRLSLEKEWFRGYIVYIKDTPCAFWNGVLYKKTFFTGTTGFDPAYREHRPGTFLLMKVFEDLCEHESLEAVDFGLGDAQYKWDFCDEHWEEMSVYVFAPTLRGALLNAIRGVCVGLYQLINRMVGKDLRAKVKRLWRQRSTPKAAGQAAAQAVGQATGQATGQAAGQAAGQAKDKAQAKDKGKDKGKPA